MLTTFNHEHMVITFRTSQTYTQSNWSKSFGNLVWPELTAHILTNFLTNLYVTTKQLLYHYDTTRQPLSTWNVVDHLQATIFFNRVITQPSKIKSHFPIKRYLNCESAKSKPDTQVVKYTQLLLKCSTKETRQLRLTII